jgi:PAS domain S-box-containing protein
LRESATHITSAASRDSLVAGIFFGRRKKAMLQNSRRLTIKLIALLAAIGVIFALDRVAHDGMAVAILYVPLLVYAAWSFSPRFTWLLYSICAILTLVDLTFEVPNFTSQAIQSRTINGLAELLIGALAAWMALTARRYATKLQQTCDSLQNSESQLRNSEALYRSLINNLPQCVFRKDLDGKFTFANARFCEAVGRSVEQVVGATDFDHCPVHLAIKYRADDRRVAENAMVLEVVEDLQLHNGKVCQLQTIKTPVFDAQGRIIGTQGIFWDITEKLRAEQSLRRSERMFRTLAENMPDIVARFDRQFRHTYVNRTVENLTGLPVHHFLGKTNGELNMPRHLVRLWEESINAVFASGESKLIEFAYEGQDGLRHFECRLTPEFAIDGSVESVLAICCDVTDRVCAQEQKQLHLTELAHATRLSMIGGLVSEIAHEINQPLHAIDNFSQAAINVLEKTPAEQRPNLFNWLKQISEQTNRAAQIIRNAGRFVRKTPSRRSQLNMSGLVRDSLLLINFDLRQRQVLLKCDLAENLPPVIGDPIQIQQVLMNLLRNAMESVSENPEEDRRLLVRTAAYQGSIHVSVHDNGSGLNPESLEKAFEPFFTTKSEGIGLGLAVCQSIVESHNGRLWAENNPEQGATFYFTLPAHKEQPHDVCCLA